MDTMNALVWKGDGALSLERRPVPTLQGPRDAIVRVTRSTICTSDLHIRNGAVPRARPGVVLGHEFVGVVEAVGNGISNLRPGDRVAACCESFCGDCWFCRRGYVNNCVHGGWELGCRIDGCQAEYVRVPFADTGLTPIPDALSDEDALFVGDILASGYWGAELCAFQPGDTAVVLGLGPVGLCAAECAALLGAARVVGVEPALRCGGHGGLQLGIGGVEGQRHQTLLQCQPRPGTGEPAGPGETADGFPHHPPGAAVGDPGGLPGL